MLKSLIINSYILMFGVFGGGFIPTKTALRLAPAIQNVEPFFIAVSVGV